MKLRISISALIFPLLRLVVTSMLLSLPQQAASRGEYEIKAAFLVNFTHFVEWPASPQAEPFSLCVVGPDPFGEVLEKVVGNRMVNNKPIVIKRLSRAVSDSSCQIAFLGDLEPGTLRKLLSTLEASHSLTVGDSPKFAEQYGVIGFTLENNRVGLALNAERAAKSGLKINSQLMRVARIVSGGQP